ncbi:MAG: 50S ribosomal protein L13 [bacterium]|nr:50S ribosomal protein L13 [bacterium]
MKFSPKTSTPTREQKLDKKWYLLNAEGKILGHLATQIADILRGKNKPTFAPHMDMGDHVIVINAEKIKVTGTNKPDQKMYTTHSGYPGHIKRVNLATMLKKRPLRVLESAVSGMLPKNRLRPVFLKKLHLYEGGEHGHEAQKPIALS